MNTEYSIEVQEVKKNFKVYLDKGSTLKERILFPNRNRHEERHILNGISFKIAKGQTVGLIGCNGCGKSTMLKLLTKIYVPNSGVVQVLGRVSSLIELGAGFHPDMSGRENIYINASIFGLKKQEIDAKLRDIIRFSELEDHIDNPVRTYSSGMYMRLAFAVAINVNADVLLIDEILAVGDVSFQKKCFEKLKEIKENGTTIVIVSHSMDHDARLAIVSRASKRQSRNGSNARDVSRFVNDLRSLEPKTFVQPHGARVVTGDFQMHARQSDLAKPHRCTTKQNAS